MGTAAYTARRLELGFEEEPNELLRGVTNDRSGGVVKSSLRVLSVLEYFQANPHPARTTEISRALAIPNSSADDILKTLVRTGYLAFDPRQKVYLPSYRIVTLARRLEGAFFGGTAVSDLMEEVHRCTGHTVWLCMQNDRWVQCSAIIPGSDFHAGIHVEGFTDYDWTTAAGLALLSGKPQEAVVEIAKRMFRTEPPAKRTASVTAILDKVRSVRKQGYATSRGFSAEGVTAVAAPFQSKVMRVPVAVGLVSADPEESPGTLALGNTLRGIAARHQRLAELHRANDDLPISPEWEFPPQL